MLNIERERRTNRWERAGLALAAINLILSIGVIILTISFLKMDSVLDAIGIALVIAVITFSSITAGIIWTWGICRRNTGCLAGSIACCTLPLFIFLFATMIYVCIEFNEDNDEPPRNDDHTKTLENTTKILAVFVMGFYMLFFCLHLLCYIKIRAANKTYRLDQRHEISYTATSNKDTSVD